jgi:hypothetical protein
MAKLIVRQIDDGTSKRLKDDGKKVRLGSEIAALFWNIEGNEEPLAKLPDQPVMPVTFDE